MSNMIVFPKGVTPTVTGIEGLDQVTEERFFEVGVALASAEGAMQWWLGDWYNAIPWGDKGAACEKAGINYKHAADCGAVARAFKFPARAGNLEFGHHKALTHSDLTLADRKKLLKRAAIEGLSTAALKKERNIVLGIATPTHGTQRFQTGVDALTQSVVNSLPEGTGKRTVNKVVKGLEKEAGRLKHEFSLAVEKAAEEKAKIQRDKLIDARKRADEQFEKAVKMAAGVKAFLTKEEFQLIRSCLHPDREATRERKERAFAAFNKLADIKTW